MADGNDALAKALGVLGFDPTKKGAFASGVVSEALKEVQEEQAKKQKEEAKKIALEVVGLVEEKNKIKKDFEKADRAVDGKIQGLLKRLEGGSAPEEKA